MIRVSNINGSPESKPANYYAVHSDDMFFYFFETKEEYDIFISSLPFIWNKETYTQQINDAHNFMYELLWKERDYKDENEITIYADLVVDETTTERQLEWKQEATSLKNYYLSTVDIIYNYFDIVTEETAIPVEEFIQKLPIFNG